MACIEGVGLSDTDCSIGKSWYDEGSRCNGSTEPDVSSDGAELSGAAGDLDAAAVDFFVATFGAASMQGAGNPLLAALQSALEFEPDNPTRVELMAHLRKIYHDMHPHL